VRAGALGQVGVPRLDHHARVGPGLRVDAAGRQRRDHGGGRSTAPSTARLHTHPRGGGRGARASLAGQRGGAPMVNPVLPAMAACTALKASCVQSAESAALAGCRGGGCGGAKRGAEERAVCPSPPSGWCRRGLCTLTSDTLPIFLKCAETARGRGEGG